MGYRALGTGSARSQRGEQAAAAGRKGTIGDACCPNLSHPAPDHGSAAPFRRKRPADPYTDLQKKNTPHKTHRQKHSAAETESHRHIPIETHRQVH